MLLTKNGIFMEIDDENERKILELKSVGFEIVQQSEEEKKPKKINFKD